MGALETVHDARSPFGLRALNVLLGAWLFASTFVLPHTGNSGLNDWACGLLVAATALSAVWAAELRWASTGLAVWPGFSAMILEYPSNATRLHDLALAGAILVVSLVRGRPSPSGERQVLV